MFALYRKVSMRCKNEGEIKKVVYQSAEVSGILMTCYVSIVVERQTEPTYIGMERKMQLRFLRGQYYYAIRINDALR